MVEESGAGAGSTRLKNLRIRGSGSANEPLGSRTWNLPFSRFREHCAVSSCPLFFLYSTGILQRLYATNDTWMPVLYCTVAGSGQVPKANHLFFPA
jgi:hypothetical protein